MKPTDSSVRKRGGKVRHCTNLGVRSTLALVAACGWLTSPALAQQAYTLTDLGAPSSTPSLLAAATGVNQAGSVSGYTFDPVALTYAAFRSDAPGSVTGLAAPAGFDSFYANGISSGASVVAGVARVTSTGAFQAAYNDAVSTAVIPIPTGDTFSAATGVNTAKTIVGHSDDTSGHFHAFTYSGGSSISLSTGATRNSDAYAVNTSGQVAGAADNPTRHFHAILTSSGSTSTLAGLTGATDTYAYGLNDAGDVVGESSGDGWSHAVLWPHGSTTPTDLGLLSGASYASARAVNASDVAVGSSVDNSYVTFRATVWDAAGPHDLNAFLPASASSTWVLTKATGINDAGQVSGIGLDNGQQHGFLLTPIPADVTAAVTVTRGGFVRTPRTNTMVQSVTVANTSGAGLTGPISFVLDGLTSGVTFSDATASTKYDGTSGSPYLNTAGLAAGASVILTLHFNDPSLTQIQYTDRVLTGAGLR